MIRSPRLNPAALETRRTTSSRGGEMDLLEPRKLLSAAVHHVSVLHPAAHHPSVLHPAAHAAAVRRAAAATATPTAHTGVIVEGHAPTTSAKNGKPNGASPATASSPIGKSPAQVLHAYGFDLVNFNGVLPGNGAGQTIAIIDAYYDPTVQNDLHVFDQQFGLSDPTLNVVDQTGVAITSSHHPSTDPAGPGANGSWELETSLDVEWVHAIAPAANILLVETNSSDFDDLVTAGAVYAASQPGVSVVSMSFGGFEFDGETSYDRYFVTPAGHQGVTFVASTGDAGANAEPPEYPAISPNVVAVGGTSLSLDGSGNYVGESAWSGGGGGISTQETQPTYQQGIVTQSTTSRTSPDVSFLADPNTGVAVYDSYDYASAPWIQVGGTSLSAPMFAGLLAIANQGRVYAGGTTLGSTASTRTLNQLYAAPAADFHDITTGNNGYPAGIGYDLATGLGTPVANQLIAYLSGVPARTGVALSGSGANAVVVSRDADNVHADVSVNGSQAYQLLLSQTTPFTFTGGGGDDQFTFDFSHGDPLPASGASFDGGAGNNALTIVGTTSNDTVTAGASSLTVSGGSAALAGGAFSNVPVTLNNVAAVNLAGGSGGSDTLTFTGGTRQTSADTPTNLGSPNVTVNVLSGANVTFLGDQHLAGLSINGSLAALGPGSPGATLTLTGALSILNGGTLDLAQGQLYVNAATTAMATIQGYLRNGYNGGAWNGTGAIISSAAAASGGVKSLGYAAAGEGVVATIPAGEILVKYTAAGDADLSGTADFNDFLILQNNFGTAGDWASGDFNYDGVVDYNDFLFLQNV